MKHNISTALFLIATLYALFGDDFKIAFFSKAADDTFSVITIVIMAIFVVEIIVNSIVDITYPFSFYFWLDVFSTVSLILDITWVWEAMTDQTDDYTANDASTGEKLARAGKGARIGSRASRITRVVRLIRLIRIGRLWKAANTSLNKRAAAENEAHENSILLK